VKVLMEASPCLTSPYRGWGRYALEMIKALSKLPELELHVFYNSYPDSDHNLARFLQRLQVEIHPFYMLPIDYTAAEEDFSRSFIDAQFPDIDVYHSLAEFPWLTERARLVTTIHDVSALAFRKRFDSAFAIEAERYLHYAMTASDALVAVSNSTKNDLVRYCGAGRAGVTVIENGVSDEFLSISESAMDAIFPASDRFVLYVGAPTDPCKDFELLLRAFARLDTITSLVVVQNEMAESEFFSRFSMTPRTRERVHILRGLRDPELNRLYRRAGLFVYPSIHEGFGLPLAEAMAAGCPVLYADVASSRELAAGCAVAFTSGDEDDLVAKMKYCLERYPIHLLDRAMSAVSERFRWDDAAQKYYRLYQQVCSVATQPQRRRHLAPRPRSVIF